MSGKAPKVVIGMPVYNGAAHLRQALDALLRQSFRDFRVVLYDDGSSDDSYAIAQEYARDDPRLRTFRGESRSGLVSAWVATARLAGEGETPDWFAWYADHDWVEHDWLEQLLDASQRHPTAVLVHARTVHVSQDGTPTGQEGFPLDTGTLEIYDRIRMLTLGRIAAGDTVYGLVRHEHLRRCGYFPMEILPDRLLVSELGLMGDIVAVPSAIRYRRLPCAEGAEKSPVPRQLKTLFEPGTSPAAPYLSHATYFLRKCMAGGLTNDPLPASRIYHALTYFYRHFNKFRSECEVELRDAPRTPEHLDILEFVSQAGGGKLKVLYREHLDALHKLRASRHRLASFKGAYRDVHDRLVEQTQRFAREREALHQETRALQDQLAQSRTELESACSKAKETISSLQKQVDDSRLDLTRLQAAHAQATQTIQRLNEERSRLEDVMNHPMRVLWKVAMRR